MAFQLAQEAKRLTSQALRSGDRASALDLLQAASVQLRSITALTPYHLTGELVAATDELDGLAERIAWDDTSRLSKESLSSWHRETRRRGRSA